jgi:hypothetical protein
LPTRRKGRRNLVNLATSEDRVNRNFTAPSKNALWLTDLTEHKTREGTLLVLDPFSRRVVGWAIDRRNEATLVNDTLTMAANSRITSPRTILHSDHGSQGQTQLALATPRERSCWRWVFENVWQRFARIGDRSLAQGLSTEDAAAETGVSPPWAVGGSATLEERHRSLEYLTPDEVEALRSDHNQARTLISVGQ